MDASGVEIQSEQFEQFARLIVLDGECTHREFFFLKEASLGRGPENAVRIRHGSVSDRHATIQEKNGDFILTDLGSTNGTWINQVRVKERTLSHGERIRLGTCELVFMCFRGQTRRNEPAVAATASDKSNAEHTQADAAQVVDHSSFSQSQVVQTPQQQRGPATMLRGEPHFELMARILSFVEFAPRNAGIGAACGDVLEKVLEILSGERGVILQLERGVPVVRAVRRTTAAASRPVQVPRDVIQRILGERKGVLCSASADELRAGPKSQPTGDWIKSLAAVPIIGADYLMGVLYVDSLSDSNALDRDALQALLLVGRCLGVLFREMEHAATLSEQGDSRSMVRRYLPDHLSAGDNALELPKKPVQVDAIILRAAMVPSSTEPVGPESAVMLQEAFLSRVQKVVKKCGGVLEVGGALGVKAVFGFPDSKPDLAALLAALAIVREGVALSLKARLSMGLELTTRITLEEGPVVVAAAGSGAHMHIVSAGTAVDVAGRLTGFAEPGEVLVGPGIVARWGEELRLGRTVEVPRVAGAARSLLALAEEFKPARVQPTRASECIPSRIRHFRSELIADGLIVSQSDTPDMYIVHLPQTDRTSVLAAGEYIYVELGGAFYGPEVSFLAQIAASDVADPSEDGTVTLRVNLVPPRLLEMS